MKRKFLDAMHRFEEALALMSGWARRSQREEWMGTPESDRLRCAASFEALGASWFASQQDLETLRVIVDRCLAHYAGGLLHEGELDVKEIDAFLSGLRDKVSGSGGTH